MRHFIFLTNEGTTFQPSDADIGDEIENAQVLGWGDGEDEDEAIRDFARNHSYLYDSTFNEAVMYELVDLKIKGRYWFHPEPDDPSEQDDPPLNQNRLSASNK